MQISYLLLTNPACPSQIPTMWQTILSQEYDSPDKILALMAQRAYREADECPTVNHWSEEGLLTVCMDFEGHSPVFYNFKIYSDKNECIAENKAQGYVSYVDDKVSAT